MSAIQSSVMSKAALLRAAAGSFFVLLTGCSVALSADTEVIENRCATNEDCAGGVCAALATGNSCVSTTADLNGVILEVSTKSDTGNGQVLAQSISIQGKFEGGAIQYQDLEVPPLVKLSGQVQGFEVASRNCDGGDETIPVTIELRNATEYIGLGGTYTATTVLDENGVYVFDVNVAAGRYDVHVRPQACDDTETPPPPVFLADQSLTVDTTLSVTMSEPKQLSGTLAIPEGQDVTGWTLEMVEPRHGLVISETMVLGMDAVSADGLLQIEGPAPNASALLYQHTSEPPIIRLRDAEGQLTVQWPIETVDLDGDGVVALELFDLQSEAKGLEASVVDENGQPVAASVTMRSKLLTGSANKNAVYRVFSDTDADGKFDVALVPGTYQVVAEPVDDERARAVAEWTVKDTDLCCGRTLVLYPKMRLSGVIRATSGLPLTGTPVLAAPSAPGFVSYFETIFEPNTVEVLAQLPRQSSTSLGSGGGFDLFVDGGRFDLSVKPEAQSGFPWLVRPSTTVEGGDGASPSELGTLNMPNPAVLTGTISTAVGGGSGAVVRAWIPVASTYGLSNDSERVRVIQIGEATADDTGRYTLPLPPTIALSPTTTE